VDSKVSQVEDKPKEVITSTISATVEEKPAISAKPEQKQTQ
jgi:hypothetical protein